MADAKARDIARNIDYLRVLAGEKSMLSADPTKEHVGYVAFGGSGTRVANAGNTLSSQNTNTTGEKRRVIKDGMVTIATGLSDMSTEREKRAAAAKARLTQAPADSGTAST
jgi:hypothetical protein